jgi:multiple sugar transport system permease protein
VPSDRIALASARPAPAAEPWRLRRLAAAAGKLLAMAFVLLWSLGPIALIVVAAFTPEREIFAVGPSAGWRPTLENFVALWTKWGDFFTGLLNSLIVTIGATLLAVTVSTLAGFGYSRWRSRFLSGSVFAMIALRLLPPIVTTLPLFPIVNALGLSDTYAVLIILYAAFFVSLGTMVMRTFVDQIPRELDEAALMDGASQRQVWTRSSCRCPRKGWSRSRSSSSSMPGTSSSSPSSSRRSAPRPRRSSCRR